MARYKYQFNPESLSFRKVEFGFLEDFFKVIFTQFAASIVIGGILFIAAIYFFDSPQLESLRQENERLLYKFELLNNDLDKAQQLLTDIQERDDSVYRSVFGLDPISQSVRTAGFGGVNRYADLEGYQHSDLLINTSRRLDIMTKQLYVQSKSFDDIVEQIKAKEKMLASIPAIQPISNKDLTGFGPFGMRLHPILNIYRLHAGVDLVAKQGTPIYAAGDGVVTNAEYNSGLGYYVKIDHGYGYKTVYGHAVKLLAKPGQRVKRGEVIALVGTTGLSTTPHLHYEVHKNNRPVNPVNFYYNDLSQEEYDRMIELSQEGINPHISLD